MRIWGFQLMSNQLEMKTITKKVKQGFQLKNINSNLSQIHFKKVQILSQTDSLVRL